MIDGYLHTNGSLIYQTNVGGGQVADFRESDCVTHFWSVDVDDRERAWSLLVEALALGVDPVRVSELATKWQCTDNDAAVFADRLGVTLKRDGDAWCAHRSDFVDLQSSAAGFGSTCLEAMGGLCQALGMRAAKMWGPTFRSLVTP